jgi:hypothetical protein
MSPGERGAPQAFEASGWEEAPQALEASGWEEVAQALEAGGGWTQGRGERGRAVAGSMPILAMDLWKPAGVPRGGHAACASLQGGETTYPSAERGIRRNVPAAHPGRSQGKDQQDE